MRNVVLTLFFLSGATGLAYEIIWTRQIGVLLGNTVYVVSMVLAAFMGGLAAGSFFLGRWADRRTDHLRIYGLLEIAVALYCLSLPWLIDRTVPLFRTIYAATGGSGPLLQTTRAFVAWLLLLLPSFLMGGTLPVLSKFVARTAGSYGKDMGLLYAVNTLGAVVGALGTGFFFIRMFGVGTTLLGATAITGTVGILSVGLQRYVPVSELPPREETRPEPAARVEGETEALWIATAVFAVSGFAAMSYEVIWTRLLALFVGPSTYAFTIVLAAFICGLAYGSAFFSKRAAAIKNLWLALAALQVGVGVAMVFLMNLTRFVYSGLGDTMNLLRDKLFLLYLFQFFILYAMLLVPTTLSGGVFPLVCQSLRAPKERLGKAVGGLYAGNAIGAVAGSLCAGFVLIPALGIRGSMRVTILVNLFLGFLLVLYVLYRGTIPLRRRDRRRATALIVTGLVYGILALTLPGWSRNLLIHPPYMVVSRRLVDPMAAGSEGILHYEEGVNGTVAVLEGGGVRSLLIEGKPDASAWSPGEESLLAAEGEFATDTDMLTQVVVGHLPMFGARNRSEVLIIGLASGVTVGSVEQHPDVQSIICAEIAPEMYRATRFFDHVNHNALDDARLSVVFEDGRNHLLMNKNRYDVIISEPSNPWMPGAARLFTREAFQAAGKALKEDGLMCMWVQAYSIQPEVMKSIIRSFSEVFPYVTMFRMGEVDYCLIGTHYPLRLNETELAWRFAVASVRDDLERVGVCEWTDLTCMCVATTASLRRAVENDTPNTDDNSRVEFLSPLALTADTVGANARWVNECGVSVDEIFDESVSPETVDWFEQGREISQTGSAG
jgi:spermidine synthase